MLQHTTAYKERSKFSSRRSAPCSPAERSSARLAPQPWWQQGGLGALSSYLLTVTRQEAMATEGGDQKNVIFQKHNSFAGKKKPKPTSETRNYYSTGLFCVSQEITSDCTKRLRSREVIQKSSLLSNFPNLKSHSWGNNVFQAKLKHACNLSEGPGGKPQQKAKLMHASLFWFHVKP